mmetsp:Transcript_21098/g.38679  ORF Transcript_21098/g.38679 Transcript_21098/m.38679 type:complete len:86 (+) Transcript_21098:473-730(+)
MKIPGAAVSSSCFIIFSFIELASCLCQSHGSAVGIVAASRGWRHAAERPGGGHRDIFLFLGRRHIFEGFSETTHQAPRTSFKNLI